MSHPPSKKYKQTSIDSFLQTKLNSNSKDSDICLDTSTPLPSKVSTLGDRSGQMSGKSEEIKPTAQLSQATFDSTQDNSSEIFEGNQSQSPNISNAESSFDSLYNAAGEASATLPYGNDSSPSQECSNEVKTSIRKMRLFPNTNASPRRHKPSNSRHKMFVKTPTVPGELPKPSSETYIDCWDGDHVRMPCSPSNIYPDEHFKSKTCKRWSLIESSLTAGMISSYDIEEAILHYNSRYKGKWNFAILHQTINEEMTQTERNELFNHVLPFMAIPLLRKQQGYSLTFSQQQVASLLANAFFCTFPRRNATGQGTEFASYPSINFNGLFCQVGKRVRRENSMIHKLKCIFHYFKKISLSMPCGCVTFKRKVVSGLSAKVWSDSTRCLTDCHFTSEKLIEDFHGAVQADFANCMIGGGVLRMGCVQEEIQFLTHPELLISRLFTQQLDDNEVLIMKGAEKYSNYKGYGDSFEFDGDHTDITAFDDIGRRYRHIIGMDASYYSNTLTQYQMNHVIRELNKAYSGFYSNKDSPIDIATGNWGCGAFNGNHYFKGVLQLMVAAECDRQLHYSVFGDHNVEQKLTSFYQFCKSHNVTVGTLWKQIAEYQNQTDSRTKKENPHSVLSFIMRNLNT
ncbi:PARG [Bugula neritina]|uniref:poly(ADP-ribose) glycohydrolase n=1 Tax=Bugula neritina TaxID=10212 RepID=A0A7J7IU25_BUGNE|nr:PARG [Bugula neritina]